MKHSGMLGTVPTENGLYLTEVFYGWKVLQWHDGGWWHSELVGRWTATPPVQWIGPLPPLLKKEQPAPSYDL